MQGLNAVHRWQDVEQVSLVLRDMRVWDEDGVPDPQAAEFGEFVLKVRCNVCAECAYASSSSVTVVLKGIIHQGLMQGSAT
jgi:hypothetical protein